MTTSATGFYEIRRDGRLVYLTLGLGKVPGVMKNGKLTVSLSPDMADEAGDALKSMAKEARGG